MTELEINKTIHEAMGKCWHEPLPFHRCSKKVPHNGHCWFCQKPIFYEQSKSVVITQEGLTASICDSLNCSEIQQKYIDEYGHPKDLNIYRTHSYTSSWSDYGQAIEWAMKQEWWDRFKTWFCCEEINKTEIWWNASNRLLNPLRGSIALAEFIKERPESFKETKNAK